MPTQSKLLFGPPLHPAFDLFLIDDLTLVGLATSALDPLANVDRVLDVFPTDIVREDIEHSTDLFLYCSFHNPLSTVYKQKETRSEIEHPKSITMEVSFDVHTHRSSRRRKYGW